MSTVKAKQIAWKVFQLAVKDWEFYELYQIILEIKQS